MARKSSIKEFYVMDGGLIGLDKSLMTGGIDQGKWIDIPVPMFLIITNQGNVLVDTGMNPDNIKDEEEAWGKEPSETVPLKMKKENDVRECLKKLGLKPDDIKYVINTHFHWDHVGGNRFFSKSKFISQVAEYRFARYPDHWYGDRYLKKDFDYDLNYTTVEGDVEIVPGVWVLLTNGHTPGHESIMLLDVPDAGNIILSGDAIYMRENIEKGLAPGICWNGDLAVRSIRRLISLSKLMDAHIIVSHDLEYWKTLPLSPKKYTR